MIVRKHNLQKREDREPLYGNGLLFLFLNGIIADAVGNPSECVGQVLYYIHEIVEGRIP